MITIERTRDMELVKRFMTDARVYPHITDDSCPTAEDFKPVDIESVIYALVLLDGEPVGVFVFMVRGAATVEVHTCLGRKAWGKSAEAAKAVIAWIFNTTDFVRINTEVPSYNLLADRLCKAAGMSKYGVCPKSYKKGGVLYDVSLYGISKG